MRQQMAPRGPAFKAPSTRLHGSAQCRKKPVGPAGGYGALAPDRPNAVTSSAGSAIARRR